MRKWTLALTLVALTVAAGCGGGGGGDVTSPSAASQIPNVAGSYSGPVTWTIDGVPFVSMGMQLNVVQAGSQLTINGNINVDGQVLPLTAVTGNVNATGFFTATSGGAMSAVDPDCGVIRALESSLTFSGRSAQYVERDATTYCGTWSFSGTLTR
jgi:hypothetical protein